MLVLDVSGSMKEEIYSYTYINDNSTTTRNNLTKGATYYIEVNGSYKKLEYKKKQTFMGIVIQNAGWYVGDEDAARYDGYKIYTRSTTTRMQALKDSVNQFVLSLINRV